MTYRGERFQVGKILHFVANHFVPLSGDASSTPRFWAKSYGGSELEEGDIVRVSVQHERATSNGRGKALCTYNQEWQVTEVKPPKQGALFDEYLTYFKRLV